MTEHLPECRHASHTHAPDPWCDCKILRVCEKRVLGSVVAAVLSVSPAAWPYDAASDTYIELISTEKALAAIDALREEKP